MHYLEQYQDKVKEFISINIYNNQYIAYSSEPNGEIQVDHRAFVSEDEYQQFIEQKLNTFSEMGFQSTQLQLTFPKIEPQNIKKFHQLSYESFLIFYVHQSISNGDINQIESLIALLEKESKKFIKALFKSIQTYWLEYQSGNGRRANQQNSNVIFLLACKFLKESDISTKWAYLAQSLVLTPTDPIIQAFVVKLKPDWFNKFLKINLKSLIDDHVSMRITCYMQYQLIRSLEHLGLIQFEEQVYLELIPRLNFCTNQFINDHKWTKEQVLQQFLDYELSYKRDIPFILSRDVHFKIKNYHCPFGDEFWIEVIQHLDAHQKLDRHQIFSLLLGAQYQDWKIPTKSFYRKIFFALEPTTSEIIELQSLLFKCLASEYPTSILFATEQCKNLLNHPNFQLNTYLNILEKAAQQEHVSSAISTIYIQTKKLLSKNTTLLSPEFIQQIITINFHLLEFSSAKTQNEIAEYIAEIVKIYASQLDLNAIDTLMLQYKEHFKGRTASILKDLDLKNMGATSKEKDQEPAYNFKQLEVNWLDISQPLNTAYTWENFVKVFSVVRGRSKVYAVDQFFSIWLRLRDQKPLDYKIQLDGLIRSLLCPTRSTYLSRFQIEMWYFFNANEDLGVFAYLDYYKESKGAVQIINGLIEAFKLYDTQRSNLEMLSLPTHEPSFIDARVLVERLLQYQKQQIKYHISDLSVAIARLPDQDFSDALKLIKQLKDPQLKLLLSCAFNPEFTFTSLTQLQLNQINQSNDLISIWTTAYLTRHPDVRINSVEKQLPNRCQIDPSYHPRPYHFSQKDTYDHKRSRYITHTTITLEKPDPQPLGRADLYAHQFVLYQASTNHREYSGSIVYRWDDLFYRHLSPSNTILYDLSFISYSCTVAEKLSDEIDKIFEYWSNPHIRLSCYAIFVLCCYLYHKKLKFRSLAIKVLSQKIEQQSIKIDFITQHLLVLVQSRYEAINRLSSSIEQISQTSKLHQLISVQILEHILEELEVSEDFVREAKRLLELYDQLIIEIKHKPSPKLIQKLSYWTQVNKSIKSVSQRIILFSSTVDSNQKAIVTTNSITQILT